MEVVTSSFERISDYVDSGSNCCPACGSPKTDRGKPVYNRFSLTVEFSCKSCESGWSEHYLLMKIENEDNKVTIINDCVREYELNS